MVHDRISVNPMAMFALPYEEEAKALAAMGARRVGVASRKLAERGWGRGLDTLRQADLEIAYLVNGVFTPVDQKAAWSAESEMLLRTVEAAAEVGAPFVYFCSGPPGSLRWEDAVDALAERLAPVIERSTACGVDLVLENALSIRADTSFFYTIADTVETARRLGIGVCADLYCACLEPGLRQTLRDGVDVIRLVQVSDRDLGSIAQPDRRVPGDGNLPLDSLLTDVVDAGYPGLFDLELLGPQIEAEGAPASVGRGTAWLSQALDRLLP